VNVLGAEPLRVSVTTLRRATDHCGIACPLFASADIPKKRIMLLEPEFPASSTRKLFCETMKCGFLTPFHERHGGGANGIMLRSEDQCMAWVAFRLNSARDLPLNDILDVTP